MNGAILNTILTVKDMSIAMDALYKTTKILAKKTRKNTKSILLLAALSAYIAYQQDNKIKKLSQRITELEYKCAGPLPEDDLDDDFED